MAFIDYERESGSLEVPAVMEALRYQEVQEAYVHILGNIYENSTAKQCDSQENKKISYQESGRQRDKNCPMLFTACLEQVFKLFDLEGYLVARIND